MKLQDVLEHTASLYREKGLADVQWRGNRDDDDAEPHIWYQGHILDKNGRPACQCGFALVVTPQPKKTIRIVDHDGDNAPEPGTLPSSALDWLAGVVSFGKGRAGVMWVNAGAVGMLGGQAIVNAARRYQNDVAREEAGQSAKPSSRKLRWDQFVKVNLIADPTNRSATALDWLGASAMGFGVGDSSRDDPGASSSEKAGD
jgi:hypothetical protein